MKKNLLLLLIIIIQFVFFSGCTKQDSNPAGTDDNSSITPVPSFIQTRVGGTGMTLLTNATLPLTLLKTPSKGSVIIEGSMVMVTGNTLGLDTVIVGDASNPQKKAVIVVTITVAAASPNYAAVQTGKYAYLTLEGGTKPYSIKTLPDTLKAFASVIGSTLTIIGKSAGTTSVIIKDASSPENLITVPVYVTQQFVASDSNVSVSAGQSATVTFSGGTAPYRIYRDPNSSYATAQISGSTVTINGMAAGTTTLQVKDSSSPENYITIYVTVTASAGISANPSSVSVTASSSSDVIISGGTPPYSIKIAPVSSVATASISGSKITVAGVGAGTTSLTVGDNSSPQKTLVIPVTVTVGSGLSSSPSSALLAAGTSTELTISGGALPYSIKTPPSSGIASASFSGSKLTITGTAQGTTSVIVGDNSSPQKTLTISITVGSSATSFTTSGQMNFSSDKASISFNGILNGYSTNGTGAGGFLDNSSGTNEAIIYGVRVNSVSSIDIVLLQIMTVTPIAAGQSYSVPSAAYISYFPGVNPNDTSGNQSFYITVTGTVGVSSLTSSNIAGTFSGTGNYWLNGNPVYNQTIAVSSSTFNVPYLIGSPSADKNIDPKIKALVMRLGKNLKH